MQHFIHMFLHYLYEILPALAIGFLISALIHELMPEKAVLKHLGSGGMKSVFYATLIGAVLPVCCWGSLPIAVSFYKKGARLGPVLAFLVATPATSASAVLVTASILGLKFAVYVFFAVIMLGMVIGAIGNAIKYKPKDTMGDISCPHCETGHGPAHAHQNSTGKKTIAGKIIAILKYAYIELPKEIGVELVIGIILAASVAAFVPIGQLVKLYLGGWFGYVFSVVFGLGMYLCATASIPLVDSLIKQGMSVGAGMALLIIGPITSYGTILVLKKEFGMKVLAIFLISLVIISILLGIGFQIIQLAI